jgi:hypothetical protein
MKLDGSTFVRLGLVIMLSLIFVVCGEEKTKGSFSSGKLQQSNTNNTVIQSFQFLYLWILPLQESGVHFEESVLLHLKSCGRIVVKIDIISSSTTFIRLDQDKSNHLMEAACGTIITETPMRTLKHLPVASDPGDSEVDFRVHQLQQDHPAAIPPELCTLTEDNSSEDW